MQKQVAQIQAQAAVAGKSPAALAKEKEKELRAKEKAEEEKRRKEEAALIKPVQAQKVPFGVDPKTVLCAFFKAGHCDKGNKCKFSHDPDVGRKVDKRNLYEDKREDQLAGTLKTVSPSSRREETVDSTEVVVCQQIRWTNGTRRSYGVSSYPSMEIHGQQPTYASSGSRIHTISHFYPCR